MKIDQVKSASSLALLADINSFIDENLRELLAAKKVSAGFSVQIRDRILQIVKSNTIKAPILPAFSSQPKSPSQKALESSFTASKSVSKEQAAGSRGSERGLRLEYPPRLDFTQEQEQILVKVTAPLLATVTRQRLYTAATLVMAGPDVQAGPITIEQLSLARFRKVLSDDELLPNPTALLWSVMKGVPYYAIRIDRYLQGCIRNSRSMRSEWADIVVCLRKYSCFRVIRW